MSVTTVMDKLMDNTQIIVEEIVESQIITEGTAADKKYFIEGIFLQSEVKNGNGRIYPKRVLSEAREVYSKDYISKGRGYGELGHPEKPGINFERLAILTQSLTEDGNNIRGRAKVIDTPMGRIVKTLIDEGVTLGVSSRGRGGIKNGVVQNGFRLVTAVDVVADPSAPDAFVTALTEGREWIMENGHIVERDMEELRNGVLKANKSHLAEAQTHAMISFMRMLAKNK